MGGVLVPQPAIQREGVGDHGGIVRPVFEWHGRRIARPT
jgi:hypothetical protein